MAIHRTVRIYAEIRPPCRVSWIRTAVNSKQLESTFTMLQNPGRPPSNLPVGLSRPQYASQPGPSQAPAKIYHAHTPRAEEMDPNPRNRLFLAVRSGIESEIDWALPRLVLGSFERPEAVILEKWTQSVLILLEWPQKWLEQLEHEAAFEKLRSVGGVRAERKEALGAMPEWTRDPMTQTRAINSLLILRNASLSGQNAKTICRPAFVELVERLFSLPYDFLLESTLACPEPWLHLLVILAWTWPYFTMTPSIRHILGTVLATLLIDSRDIAMILSLLSICIMSIARPGMPNPPVELVPHMFKLLSLTPPGPLLDHVLDLLVSITLSGQLARSMLADRSFSIWLRALTILLEHGARPWRAEWEAPNALAGVKIQNPASQVAIAEAASASRNTKREEAQQLIERNGGPVQALAEVGNRPPSIASATRQKLYKMTEPERSIAWWVVFLVAD